MTTTPRYGAALLGNVPATWDDEPFEPPIACPRCDDPEMVEMRDMGGLMLCLTCDLLVDLAEEVESEVETPVLAAPLAEAA
jgi:hypothetical protein